MDTGEVFKVLLETRDTARANEKLEPPLRFKLLSGFFPNDMIRRILPSYHHISTDGVIESLLGERFLVESRDSGGQTFICPSLLPQFGDRRIAPWITFNITALPHIDSHKFPLMTLACVMSGFEHTFVGNELLRYESGMLFSQFHVQNLEGVVRVLQTAHNVVQISLSEMLHPTRALRCLERVASSLSTVQSYSSGSLNWKTYPLGTAVVECSCPILSSLDSVLNNELHKCCMHIRWRAVTRCPGPTLLFGD